MSLSDIIAQELGDINQEIDFDQLINQVIENNKKTIDKIIKKQNKSSKKGGKGGPIMFLVGEVLKLSNKQGDPKKIEEMIAKAIEEKT